MSSPNYEEFRNLVGSEVRQFVSEYFDIQPTEANLAKVRQIVSAMKSDPATHHAHADAGRPQLPPAHGPCLKCGGNCAGGACTLGSDKIAKHTPFQSQIRACGLDLKLPNFGGGEISTKGGKLCIEPGTIIPKRMLNCVVAIAEECAVENYATGTAVYYTVTVSAASMVTGTAHLGPRFGMAIRLPAPDRSRPLAGLGGLITIDDALFLNALAEPFVPNRVSLNGTVWKLREGTTSDVLLHQFGSDGTNPNKLSTTPERCNCDSIMGLMPHEGVGVVIVETGGIPLGSVTLSGHYVVGTLEKLAKNCELQTGCASPPWLDVLGANPNAIAITVDSDVFIT